MTIIRTTYYLIVAFREGYENAVLKYLLADHII